MSVIKSNTAIASNIQRFSVDDGPGIRTTVFLKGCNLNCIWCHNPECINPAPQMSFDKTKCSGCNSCVPACLLAVRKDIGIERPENGCVLCGKCIEGCFFNALQLVGKTYSINELFRLISRDEHFFKKSGGGITFSGGEPLLQIDFVEDLAEKLRAQEINVAIDTAGNVSWNVFERIMPYANLFLFDLKVLNENKHIQLTGVSNKLILDNLQKLSESPADIWIRIPVIEGLNDSVEEMEDTARFVSENTRVKHIDLLPYHEYGANKHINIGMEMIPLHNAIPSNNHLISISEIFRKYQLEVNIS